MKAAMAQMKEQFANMPPEQRKMMEEAMAVAQAAERIWRQTWSANSFSKLTMSIEP